MCKIYGLVICRVESTNSVKNGKKFRLVSCLNTKLRSFKWTHMEDPFTNYMYLYIDSFGKNYYMIDNAELAPA